MAERAPLPDIIDEQAKAKVNLTLHVGPPRDDGYHPVESLVVFADYGDELSLQNAESWGLTIDGPFAAGLSGQADNLILQAGRWAAQSWGAKSGHFHLTKNLPIASGLGGGSADAAAALRLLARRDGIDIFDYDGAESLGADVPVCLLSKTCLMSGIGERLSLVEATETLSAVLVNPGVGVSTGAIFTAYDRSRPAPLSSHPDWENGLVNSARAGRNDLQIAAIAACPDIAVVLGALRECDGQILTRMSGSGASCFALFSDDMAAQNAARQLSDAQPKWWVQAVRLGEAAQ